MCAIKDNNKLIAEFMGYKKSIANTWFKDKKIVQSSSFKYDSDWNWLMEVVERIELLYDGGFDVNILSDGTIIQQFRNSPNSELSDGVEIVRLTSAEIGFEKKINHTYMAVVEFIKWYNN